MDDEKNNMKKSVQEALQPKLTIHTLHNKHTLNPPDSKAGKGPK
jgi:hypothetical protein